MENSPRPIKTYKDLEVYRRLYEAMRIVLKEIIPRLPKEEKYDLADQMRRCSKGMPALVAEGFAKRYQKKSWSKYLDDTQGEINEIQHHLNVCLDIYGEYIKRESIENAKELYEISGKQAYRLKSTWVGFHERRN